MSFGCRSLSAHTAYPAPACPLRGVGMHVCEWYWVQTTIAMTAHLHMLRVCICPPNVAVVGQCYRRNAKWKTRVRQTIVPHIEINVMPCRHSCYKVGALCLSKRNKYLGVPCWGDFDNVRNRPESPQRCGVPAVTTISFLGNPGHLRQECRRKHQMRICGQRHAQM